ncbi:glycoside hydrolase [Pararcticibacter amylolyticus]|uniref:Glycoside hydrolase n=2 Tax=Pararcticibacter amylolyticus TaxID=2173175 RepID=A0A2U2PI00_9SPHI|nr:glycoside hydrolase [Pararcticibacter amylolyticus]
MLLSKRMFLASVFFLWSLALLSQSLPPKRELRGVWVATVQNIDWPSKRGLASDVQRQELIRIFDEHQKTGINAIVLQVRPVADALYAKSREPWSMFLSGKQGQPSLPVYDPLEFAVGEAHKRGMELHAWFNPYRATTDTIDSNTSEQHISRTKPEWFFTYGGKKYFNPALPEVRAYIVQVIMDVVRNYDIDGVHFDDYFYPYPVKGQILPDSALFSKYGQGFSSVDDWRRNNVDLLIKTLSDSIHSAKRYVKFGISPFGIWRNKKDDPEGSETNGLSGYSALYADARKWMKEGWVDYNVPQVYFPFNYAPAAYEKLVDWWSNNAFGKHLYIGQGVYRATEDKEGWRDRKQLPEQVRYLRQNERVQGSVYFSSKSLTNNLAGFRDSLKNDFYKYPALQPQMIWLDAIPPLAPLELEATASQEGVKLKWNPPLPVRDGESAYGYVVYRFDKKERVDINNPKNIIHIGFNRSETFYTDKSYGHTGKYVYLVTAIDRLKNESTPSNVAKVKVK